MSQSSTITFVANAMSSTSILSEFTISDIEEMIAENSSLRGFLQGYLAERVLAKKLRALPGVTEVKKIPDQDSKKGDFLVTYKGQEITIEVKSVATGSVRPDVLNDTWQGTVRIKNTDRRELTIEGFGTVETTNLVKGQFDILAVCCFAVSGQWDFMFIENRFLPESDKIPGLIKGSFVLNPQTTACISENPLIILDDVLESRAISS